MLFNYLAPTAIMVGEKPSDGAIELLVRMRQIVTNRKPTWVPLALPVVTDGHLESML